MFQSNFAKINTKKKVYLQGGHKIQFPDFSPDI